MLDPSMALPSGLFHFRVVVGVRLLAPVIIEADDEFDEEEMVGFYRTYGVTAASASAAVALVENLYEAPIDDDTAGPIVEIDVEVLETGDMKLPKPIEEIAAAGIHFESDHAFFPVDDGDEDEDEDEDFID